MRFGQALAKFHKLGIRTDRLDWPSDYVLSPDQIAFDFERREGTGTIFIQVGHHTSNAHLVGALIPEESGERAVVWNGEAFVDSKGTELNDRLMFRAPLPDDKN